MTQNTKKWLGAAALVLSSSVLTGAVMRTSVTRSNDNSSDDTFFGAQPTSLQMPNAAPASAPAVAGLVDLTSAAERSVNSVVYIKVTQNAVRQRVRVRDPFEDFFGDFFGYGNRGQGREQEIETQPRRQGAGSGVIITSDGYIVTNNHVVAGADEILVKLNDNTEYKGRIIGLDETTDLALIICGLAEADAFSNIDYRTTINEFVEISKYYSTPESRAFVNGVLDKLINKQ